MNGFLRDRYPSATQVAGSGSSGHAYGSTRSPDPMRRISPQTLRRLASTLALVCVLAGGSALAPAGAAAAPNVVVIQTDDMTRSDL